MTTSFFSFMEERKNIYSYFHSSQKCQDYFFAEENAELYSAYYTSMYLLQDTSEGLNSHRGQGFCSGPLQAYIELWGVLQALIIHQDATAELHWAVHSQKLSWANMPSLKEIRELRNKCAGHPARKDLPKKSPLTRTFMGRGFGNYNEITYEQWQSPGTITHPRVKLGELVDNYEVEATTVLQQILATMRQKW